jgi:hypothetical protein
VAQETTGCTAGKVMIEFTAVPETTESTAAQVMTL